MRKIFVLLFALATLSMTSSVIAQKKQMTPEERATKQTEKMKEDLGLSDSQASQVQAINLKFIKKGKEAKKEAAGDKAVMKEKMKQIAGERNGELKKVLSEDQYSKLVEIQKQRQNHGH